MDTLNFQQCIQKSLAFTEKESIINPVKKNKTKGPGCVAQLVEQLTLNQWVQGSNPCAPTKIKTAYAVYFL